MLKMYEKIKWVLKFFWLIIMVNKLEKSVYLYSYTTESKELVPFVFYDNDVESVISRIYQYEQWT